MLTLQWWAIVRKLVELDKDLWSLSNSTNLRTIAYDRSANHVFAQHIAYMSKVRVYRVYVKGSRICTSFVFAYDFNRDWNTMAVVGKSSSFRYDGWRPSSLHSGISPGIGIYLWWQLKREMAAWCFNRQRKLA